jgi:hypothetical protein
MQQATRNRPHATGHMQQTTCNMQRATCNMQHATCNRPHATDHMQHATGHMQHATGHRQHVTCNMQQTTCNMPQAPCNRVHKPPTAAAALSQCRTTELLSKRVLCACVCPRTCAGAHRAAAGWCRTRSPRAQTPQRARASHPLRREPRAPPLRCAAPRPHRPRASRPRPRAPDAHDAIPSTNTASA